VDKISVRVSDAFNPLKTFDVYTQWVVTSNKTLIKENSDSIYRENDRSNTSAIKTDEIFPLYSG
jgi:hypothetical protein